MKEELKDWIRFISGIICLIGGIVISFIGLYMPPIGQIDHSVLILIGEVLTFVGALFGLHDFTQLQMKKIEHSANKQQKETE